MTKALKEITMTKRFFLVLLAMLLVLSVFTACDDDDDDSRACTEEDLEISCAILDACDEAISDDYYTVSNSGTTMTATLKTYTCTVTSWIDDSSISVTIESGSTIKIAFDSSYTSSVETYNISATVDGTSHSLYVKMAYDDDDELTSFKIELDGVELTGFYDMVEDLYSAARELASRTLAI